MFLAVLWVIGNVVMVNKYGILRLIAAEAMEVYVEYTGGKLIVCKKTDNRIYDRYKYNAGVFRINSGDTCS